MHRIPGRLWGAGMRIQRRPRGAARGRRRWPSEIVRFCTGSERTDEADWRRLHRKLPGARLGLSRRRCAALCQGCRRALRRDIAAATRSWRHVAFGADGKGGNSAGDHRSCARRAAEPARCSLVRPCNLNAPHRNPSLPRASWSPPRRPEATANLPSKLGSSKVKVPWTLRQTDLCTSRRPPKPRELTDHFFGYSRQRDQTNQAKPAKTTATISALKRWKRVRKVGSLSQRAPNTKPV